MLSISLLMILYLLEYLNYIFMIYLQSVDFLPCLNYLELNILNTLQGDFTLAIIKTVISIHRVY